MGELGLNKIFGAILAAALIVMGLQTLSGIVFPSGAHHGGHGEEKPYSEAIKDKYAYWTDVEGADASDVEEGPAYDLGLLLASADASKGERVFKSVCSSCHTIDQGGANGTGPNLHALVGRDIASATGFNSYSSALGGVEGDWTYEQLDAWIDDPKNIARGVNMVANVKKDPDRANLIAYLAANTPGAAAFPAPLPEEGEAPAEGEAEPASMEDGDHSDGGTEVTVDGVDVPMTEEEFDATLDEMEELVDDMGETVDRMEEIVEEAGIGEAPVAVTEPAEEVVRPDGEN